MTDMHIYIVARQLLLPDRTFRKTVSIDVKHCIVQNATKDRKFNEMRNLSLIKIIINKNKNFLS